MGLVEGIGSSQLDTSDDEHEVSSLLELAWLLLTKSTTEAADSSAEDAADSSAEDAADSSAEAEETKGKDGNTAVGSTSDAEGNTAEGSKSVAVCNTAAVDSV